jgi:hypothetical protein
VVSRFHGQAHWHAGRTGGHRLRPLLLLPRRRASGFAVVLFALLGVALILAGFRVDVPMLSGGSPATWHGWVHAITFLLVIATGVVAPLTMALAVRGNPAWRPIAHVSLAGSALFVVFLLLPWGNASFLIVMLYKTLMRER